MCLVCIYEVIEYLFYEAEKISNVSFDEGRFWLLVCYRF